MPSKRTIVITVILLALFIPLSLYFDTPLFFEQSTINPITVYYKSETRTTQSGPVYMVGSVYPNFTIGSFEFTVDNAFSSDKSRFLISYKDVTDWHSFYHKLGDDSIFDGYIDKSEVAKYIEATPPDMAVCSPVIDNNDGTYLFWRDVPEMMDGTNVKNVNFTSLLKQTSFGVWECELLLDASMDMKTIDGRLFAPIHIDKASITISIPENYHIENTESLSLSESSSNQIVTRNISMGEIFHLTVKDASLETFGIIMGYISGLGIPSTIIGIIISSFYDKKKKKQTRQPRTPKKVPLNTSV